jgi:hypothetical protein
MKNIPKDSHAQWIKAAIQSGPEEPLSSKKFKAAVKRGLKLAASKAKGK